MYNELIKEQGKETMKLKMRCTRWHMAITVVIALIAAVIYGGLQSWAHHRAAGEVASFVASIEADQRTQISYASVTTSPLFFGPVSVHEVSISYPRMPSITVDEIQIGLSGGNGDYQVNAIGAHVPPAVFQLVLGPGQPLPEIVSDGLTFQLDIARHTLKPDKARVQFDIELQGIFGLKGVATYVPNQFALYALDSTIVDYGLLHSIAQANGPKRIQQAAQGIVQQPGAPTTVIQAIRVSIARAYLSSHANAITLSFAARADEPVNPLSFYAKKSAVPLVAFNEFETAAVHVAAECADGSCPLPKLENSDTSVDLAQTKPIDLSAFVAHGVSTPTPGG